MASGDGKKPCSGISEAVRSAQSTSVLEGGESAAPGAAKARQSDENSAKPATAALPVVVAADGNRTTAVLADAQTKSTHPACLPLSDYMNAALFLAVLQPSADHDSLLASLQPERPHFFHDPGEGGEVLIFLEWAKAIAFGWDNTPASRLAMDLVVRALNDYQRDRGAAADALFRKALTTSGATAVMSAA